MRVLRIVFDQAVRYQTKTRREQTSLGKEKMVESKMGCALLLRRHAAPSTRRHAARYAAIHRAAGYAGNTVCSCMLGLPSHSVSILLPKSSTCQHTCGVAGNHPLLVIPSASMSLCIRSSVMTSRCSTAASLESSFADAQ